MTVVAVLLDPSLLGLDSTEMSTSVAWGATTVRAASLTNLLRADLGRVVVVAPDVQRTAIREEFDAFNSIGRRDFAHEFVFSAEVPSQLGGPALVGWLDQPVAAPALWRRLRAADLPVVTAAVAGVRAPMRIAADRWDRAAPSLTESGLVSDGDAAVVELDVWRSLQRSAEGDAVYVEECLGRTPQATYSIAARRPDGRPTVIENPPFLANGTPMPTTFWLIDPDFNRRIGTIEAGGGVNQVEAELGLEVMAEVHDRYAEYRDSLVPVDYAGHRPSGGVGGTRVGVKCLHTHYAWYLAGGPDPVEAWVHDRLAQHEENE